MIMNRRINMIVAHDDVGTIGKNNALPWRLKGDMEFFKKITTGHVVLMGRNTFESIGKPLKDRYNVVVTRDASWSHPGVSVINDIDEALLEAALIAEDRECEVFIIGGKQIYEQTVHSCDTIYLTRVYTEIEGGDTFFMLPPELTFTNSETVRGEFQNEDNEYQYRIFKFNVESGTN